MPALAMEVVEWQTCGLPWKQTPTLLFLPPHAFNTLASYHYHLCAFRVHFCLKYKTKQTYDSGVQTAAGSHIFKLHVQTIQKPHSILGG